MKPFKLFLTLVVLAAIVAACNKPSQVKDPNAAWNVESRLLGGKELPREVPPLPRIANGEHLALPSHLAQYVEATNRFGYSLYASLSREREHKNLVYSPLSLEYALGMLAYGTSSSAYQELTEVMQLSGVSAQEQAAFYRALAQDLQTSDSYQCLFLANGIWPALDLADKIKPSYTQEMPSYYDASVEALDFANPDAYKHINYWIERATYGLIPSMLSPEQVTSQTRLILSNALYFAAPWFGGFGNAGLHPFYNHGTVVREVSTLRRGGVAIEVVKGDAAEVLRLPLGETGAIFTLNILLPHEREQALTSEFFSEQHALFSGRGELEEIDLLLPLFDYVSDGLELEKLLQGMGVKDLFDVSARPLSGITEAESLAVRFILQKTTMKWDEKGLEASAATAVGIYGDAGLPREPRKVAVDHPFFFTLTHKATGKVLFIGQVNEL